MKKAILFMLMLIGVQSAVCDFEVIDQIQFGNFFSESIQHTCTFSNAPTITGGLGESARRIGEGGSITFTIACNPAEQNFLTVKLWGSDTVEGRQYLYLYDPVNRLGEYYAGIPESEVMYWDDRPAYHNRFVYSTYIIPDNLTSGKTSVTLKLADAQLGIYRVYTHLDPFFLPVGEQQGTKPAPGGAHPGTGETAYDYLVRQAEEAFDELMTWQKWGSAWDAMVAGGDAPGWMTGATTWDGRGGNASMTEQEWKEDLYVRLIQGNCDAMKVPMFYAKAYHSEWSKYYQDPELIDRVVAALDWYCIAQGANGSFDNPWGLRWIGGPDRVNGGGPLQGFGTRGPAEAFLLMQNDIPSSVLDELIDNNGNQIADVTRRDAWIQLFEWSRDYMYNTGGHATNQDVAQRYAAWQHNEALKVLAPGKAFDRSIMLEMSYRAVGILPAGKYDDITHWFSYKGVPCEGPGTSAGGYCGSYGASPLGYTAKYMQAMNDTQLANQFKKLFSAWSNFCYTANDENGYSSLVRQMCINNRPNRHVGEAFPDRVSLEGTAYAAIELGSPEAARMIQLYLQNNRLFADSIAAANVGPSPHFGSYAEGYIDLVDMWADIETLAPTSYRLPMEDSEADFVFADEESQALVVKHSEVKMYMSLNWRQDSNDFTGRSYEGAVASNVARVHYMTDQIGKIANLPMQTPHGIHELYLCKYGDYYIIMNRSDSSTTYTVSVPDTLPAFAVDLVSQTTVDTRGGTVDITPYTTMVLYAGGPQYCGDVGTIYSPVDFNQDCIVNFEDFVIYAGMWLQSVSQ